jgi:DNA uptake protein ComE-like DNA-binding protein
MFGYFPFAALAWIGYLIIGVRARNWKWLAIAALLFGWIVGWFAWAGSWPDIEKGEPHPDPVGNAWWGWLGVTIWLGNAFGLQWFVNRKWLVWRAHHSKKVWYQDATATTPARAPMAASAPFTADVVDRALNGAAITPPASSDPSTRAPARAAAAQAGTPWSDGTSRSSAEAASIVAVPGTHSVLDLNTATREQLAQIPGLDQAWADHIVATRERVGPFSQATDLVTAAGMQPHHFTEIRDRVSAGELPAPTRSAPEPPQAGRRLEF